MTMAWDEVVLSVAQMGQADAWAVNAGVSGVALMDRAGSGMCDAITRRWARRQSLLPRIDSYIKKAIENSSLIASTTSPEL